MTTSTLTTYTVVYQEMRRDDALCHVHAVGCADLTRRSNNRNGVQVDLNLDLDDLSSHMAEFDPDELGYGVEHVTVHGCATDVHNAQKANTGRRTRRAARPTPVQEPARQAVKNVKLKRGTRVHAPGVNGLPVCRATGTAEKYEATVKEVSCTSCAKVLAPVAAQEPVKPRTRRAKAATQSLSPQPAKRRTAADDVSDIMDLLTGQTTVEEYVEESSSAVQERKAIGRAVAQKVVGGRGRRNGKAHDAAGVKAAEVVAEETAKVLAKRGTHKAMDQQRNPKCSDEDYALAVRVRELRAQGEAWWRIAHLLGLPGSAETVKQGKTGAANARRAWERAWGKTYKDTSVARDTKALKKERVLTHEANPYFSEDTPDEEILDRVEGQTITWYTRVGTNGGAVVSEQVAEVNRGSGKIVQGRQGRVLEFDERIYEQTTGGSGVKTPMVGPRRSVYIDRIEKVAQ